MNFPSRMKFDFLNREPSQDLYMLNRNLATQMIDLASKSGDVGPLKLAVQTLRQAEELYSAETTPQENVEVRKIIADTLLEVGRHSQNPDALSHAVDAYRDAITLASMLGNHGLRLDLKANYTVALELLKKTEAHTPVERVA